MLLRGHSALGDQIEGVLADREDVTVCRDPDPALEGVRIAVSAGYWHRVSRETLAQIPVINCHPGYLPWNRGTDPNVWPIVDGSPAGVTLHWMDAGLDTGPIIARQRVAVEPWDTAGTLGHRLDAAMVALFARWWPIIRTGQGPRIPQPHGGSYHRRADLATLEPDPEALRLLRARSYPGYGVLIGGKRLRLEVE